MIEKLRGNVGKSTEVIIKIAAVIGAITVIAGGYSFYLENLWKPKIKVVSVDFGRGVAEILFNGDSIYLDGDDAHLLRGEWGVKMGANSDGYTSVELIKKGMVVEHLVTA